MRVRVRFAAAVVVIAGAAFAQGAAAEAGDASWSAVERRAIAASGLPRASVVSVKPDMVIAIRNRGTPSVGGGVIEGVVLQGEVVSSDAAQIMGYRSMQSMVNVDCVRRREMVVKMAVFSEPKGKGQVVNRQTPGGWVQPSPGAYLSDVMGDICGSGPRVAAAAPTPAAPARRATVAATPPKRPAVTASVPAAAPVVERARPAPDEDRPFRTSIDARLARAGAPAATPPPLRPEIPWPVADKPAPKPALKPAPAKPAAPKPAPAKPKTPGKISVQIAASSTESQAREALARVRGKVSAPLSTSVRSVTVDGKVFHRALITGFQTRDEAQAFCARLSAACFVR
ncbi:MAG: SPOR domain-containing protein [Pseudomonadota bacterium]|uniref:SPOR domain-containing protein n=1 Tax=Phenylobacterium sp. TaxID=1871053 RepID=UPI0026007446|nr:SPOR domain-containing protein [Phenylobacterium sp.]MBT9472817.1 SPOR domain-containing protein [Phenylobacterium sp.]